MYLVSFSQIYLPCFFAFSSSSHYNYSKHVLFVASIMKQVISFCVVLCFSLLVLPSLVSADLRGDYIKEPEDVIDFVVGEEKKDTGIVQTRLDYVDNKQGGFGGLELKISDTLDSVRLYL